MSNIYTQKPKRKKFIGAKFTTTVSIALVLFVIGLMAVGCMTTFRLSEELREQFTVTIEISDSAAPGYGAKLASSLSKQPYTKSATYISADSALTILTDMLGENPESFLGFNPLSASVELQMAARYAENDSIMPIVERLKAQGGANINNIKYNSVLVDRVNTDLRRIIILLLFVMILLLMICVSLISNAVRMAMHSDRFIINTMQLVGATNWFIRKPLIRQNIVCGLIAAVLAFSAMAALLWYGSSQGIISQVSSLLIHPLHISILIGCILIPGILIPAIAAWISAGKYLKHSIDDLYLM